MVQMLLLMLGVSMLQLAVVQERGQQIILMFLLYLMELLQSQQII